MAANWIVCLIVCCVLVQIGCEAFGQQRVVGGSSAQVSIPYQISMQAKANSGIMDRLLQMLLMQSRSEWTHFCGGSIISECHVITAAHCIDGADLTKISILAGTKSRLKGGERHSIRSSSIHPEYRKLQTNDIAILCVTKPFTYTASVQPIEFRNGNFVGGGTKVRLSGWGYTTPLATFTLPMTIRTIDLKTISNEECKRQGYNVSISEICTSTGVLRGACMGDSGGPLVNMERNILIGLVSYGSRICGAGRPEVYTRISEYTEWILEQISNALSPTTQSTTTLSPTPTESTITLPITTTESTTTLLPTSTTISPSIPVIPTQPDDSITASPPTDPSLPDPPVFPVAPVMPASAPAEPSTHSSALPGLKPAKPEKVPDPSFAAELDRITQTSKPDPQAATIIIEFKKKN